jgi:pyruvate dehydrogenase E2 component (dihydrolipoamide acetyltransferase)
VVAVAGKPAVHRILPLSLTFDHRAVTGGEASRFLAAVIGDLQLAE